MRRPARIRRGAAGVSLLATLGGCAYLDLVHRRWDTAAAFDVMPRLGLLRELAPERCRQVMGPIVGAIARDEPLLVIAVAPAGAGTEAVAMRIVPRGADAYAELLPDGVYDLLALADLDRDGTFRDDEVVGRVDGVAVESAVPPEQFVLDGPPLAVDPSRPTHAPVRIRVPVAYTSNVHASLDDDFFAPGWGTVGLYHPTELLAHTQGLVFGLEAFRADLVQVLFVHGLAGTPRDFRTLASGLDRTRAQPWFFFYPSGLSLEQVGAALAQVIDATAADPHTPIRRLVLVGHSAGGLVTRTAIARLCRRRCPSYLRGFASLATPWNGDTRAALGVAHAPVVLPSWEDLAVGSAYLARLPATPWPATLPFLLVFAFGDVTGDGAVPLVSQLEPRFQQDATAIYGVAASHEGMLDDPAVARRLEQFVDRAAR